MASFAMRAVRDCVVVLFAVELYAAASGATQSR
jgi:hypothetical protein